MLIRIHGTDMPGASCGPSPDDPDGYRGIHVAVQRRNRPGELLGLVPASAAEAEWTLDCAVVDGPGGVDLKGPHISGTPGRRFVYLSWGTVDEVGNFTMFRRAKLWLDSIPTAVVRRAVVEGMLVGRLGLTDHKGNPRCASVRPPMIEWTTATVG